MRDLDFLVPAVLVEPPLAAELLREQVLPTLARIVARSGEGIDTFLVPPEASPTTWQAWVFGTRAGTNIDAINVGELWAMACGVAPSTKGARYVAEPAHFAIARDHLRLDDPRDLAFTLVEARELAAVIEPVLGDAGWRLEPIEPATLHHWMLVRDEAALSAAAIDRAIGDNVAAWQPRATVSSGDVDAALAWRRCVNEIQMEWFGHPINEAREARGQQPVNTLWLSGNGAPRGAMPHYATIDSGLPLLAALSIEPDAQRSLETFDGFIAPSRNEDWSGWREQLAPLDARLEAILREQQQGTIGRLTIALCGRDIAKVLTIEPRDLGRFWRDWKSKPDLGAVFAA